MLHSALINVMVKAARRAGRSLKRDLGEVENLQVSLKGPANFVSRADHRAEEMLYEDLAKARPGYGFIGEEGGMRQGTDQSHTWIVDPLDGTTNFLHGIPQFAISIGLRRDHRRRDQQSRQRRIVHRRARQGRAPQRPAAARRRPPQARCAFRSSAPLDNDLATAAAVQMPQQVCRRGLTGFS
jgi:fructose-1,6-bisphosphatase/inositol monophosphatase family enzyme